ncbi:MAG: hypothetical protein JW982_12570 [Spirochaetes bacterium]|nr:hypothetical protein [Spirochaetota bacterium]
MKKLFPIALICIFTAAKSISPNNDIDFAYYQNQNSFINIRNPNGKFYAYIVLLYYENHHFVNMIQEDSITIKATQKENYHIKAYKQYAASIKDPELAYDANMLYNIYENSSKYSQKTLQKYENALEKRNIILKFIKPTRQNYSKTTLEYCIFGIKSKITNKHPFFTIDEDIYNIIPLIYYDELSTSNSTFYFDMIYINPEEIQNDIMIVKKIINRQNTSNLFYIGARINDDIKFCIQKAFSEKADIKNDIQSLFEIHELTHKVLNNRYNFFDQIIGEELALSSTIYSNPYLGLSIMYSYLDYNSGNPHRIGAFNYIRFISNALNNPSLYDDPGKIKNLSESEIMDVTKKHFESLIRVLQ